MRLFKKPTLIFPAPKASPTGSIFLDSSYHLFILFLVFFVVQNLTTPGTIPQQEALLIKKAPNVTTKHRGSQNLISGSFWGWDTLGLGFRVYPVFVYVLFPFLIHRFLM